MYINNTILSKSSFKYPSWLIKNNNHYLFGNEEKIHRVENTAIGNWLFIEIKKIKNHYLEL